MGKPGQGSWQEETGSVVKHRKTEPRLGVREVLGEKENFQQVFCLSGLIY